MVFNSGVVLSGEPSSQEEVLLLSFLLRYEGATREIYGYRVKTFYEWCLSHDLNIVHDVRRIHLEIYMKHLQTERGNCPATASGALGTIRSFYRMLEADEVILRNPASFVKPPRIDEQTIKRPHLNRTQFSNLLESARRSGPRDFLVISLLGIMGLRASELCSLRTDSLSDFEQGYRVLKFVGKGNKAACLPVPVMITRELDSYIASLGSSVLFPGADGRPLNRRQVYRIVRRLCREAGVMEVSPHALRRSMVTNSLNAGADIREVQKAARHSDVRTTSRIYDRGTVSHDSSSFNVLAGFISGAI